MTVALRSAETWGALVNAIQRFARTRADEDWPAVEAAMRARDDYHRAALASQQGIESTGLDAHKPHWEQDRDEQYGMWRCACNKTFAPDDFEGYHRHLAALATKGERDG